MSLFLLLMDMIIVVFDIFTGQNVEMLGQFKFTTTNTAIFLPRKSKRKPHKVPGGYNKLTPCVNKSVCV